MLKIKKWLVLLLALACLGILFACSKPGDSTGKEETPDPAGTEDVSAVQASASLECCDGEITLRFAKTIRTSGSGRMMKRSLWTKAMWRR